MLSSNGPRVRLRKCKAPTLNERPETPASEEKSAAERYYDDNTPGIYLNGWNRDHIHFGLFEPGECPEPGEALVDSPGLARAVERMVEAIVAPAGIEEGHRVVDAGCGVGGTAILLARTKGCKVTGVNINRMQLEIAAGKAADAGLENLISFEYADCSRLLPFADGSVDVVVNIESACHYSDRRQFLLEVGRILRPSGKIVAMDWMARDGLTDAEYETYIVPLCQPFAVSGLETQSTYTAKLGEAGLTALEFEGFDGRDADNLRLVGNSYNLLATLRFAGVETPGIRGLIGQFGTLYQAWKSGSFELRRYCAQKPGRAGLQPGLAPDRK